MRIIAGRWAGMELLSPGDRVRPTMEPLREASMRFVENELAGARVLDLFAGTGALGLEAMSRGARYCDFVENGTSAIHSLKANVAKVKSRDRARIFLRDAIPYAEMLSPGAYDIAFVDPPYGSKKLDRVLARWLVVPFAKVLVLEHAFDHKLVLPAPVAGAGPVERMRIEDSVVTVLRAPAAPAPVTAP
ncbi:MAG: RsmD family RNA methyltransferase [Myxococcota bacterium]